jgi:hypothetical protein
MPESPEFQYNRFNEDIPGREGIGIGSIVRARSTNDWIEQLVVQPTESKYNTRQSPYRRRNSLMANENRKEGKYKNKGRRCADAKCTSWRQHVDASVWRFGWIRPPQVQSYDHSYTAFIS